MDIGIDLGTTLSVIAVAGTVALRKDYGEGLYLEDCDVTIIPGPFGEQTFQSVVIEDPQNPGSLLFGAEALGAADANNAPIMFWKRGMGTNTVYLTGTLSLSARDVASKFLAYMRQCAELALGIPIERAVITHPAYFDRIAVEHLREAAVSAGFDMDLPDQMLMEPVAAALAYTRTDQRERLNVLTYDLGGGTFDVTVLQRSDGVINVKAFDGDHLLGGYNFDREIVNWLRQKLGTRGRVLALDMDTDFGRAAVADLLRAAEKVKIVLAQEKDIDRMHEFRARGVVNDTAGKDVLINERISRREFMDMVTPYLERTVECCRTALHKARLDPSDIHEVVMVGGSSYGPWVRQSLEALFPNSSLTVFQPELAIAVGAALHARMVLPKRAAAGDYSIQIEYPENTVADVITVTGVVAHDSGTPLQSCSVRLLSNGCQEVARTPLGAGGGFVLRDVELPELDKSNRFSIELLVGEKTQLLSYDFVVVHNSQTSDTLPVTTVLPRPLFVETYEGLVPLAEEGSALPARVKSSFVRINDNPNMELKLYQSDAVIGTVRIEHIPPEAGKGARVDLEIEVTQKNEVRGKVVIRSGHSGRIYVERPIAIQYDVIDVPNNAALEGQVHLLSEMINRTRESANSGSEDVSDVACAEAERFLAQAERLLGQVPIEAQEVSEALKKAKAFLEPSRDDMRPPRHDFFGLVEYCKKTCNEMIASAERVIAVNRSGDGLDPTLHRSYERTMSATRRYQVRLDELESAGRQASERKDRRRWLQAYDRLREIAGALTKDQGKSIAPTEINKLLARREVISLLREFHLAAAKVEAEHTIDDWSSELQRIHGTLTDAVMEITKIDDDLDDESGLLAIRKVLAHHRVAGLREDINRIGQDIRVLGK